MRSCREVFEAIDVVVDCMHDHERVRIADIIEVIAQFSAKGEWTDRQLLSIYRKANPGVLVRGSYGLYKNGPPPRSASNPMPIIISFIAEEFIKEQRKLLRAKTRSKKAG